MTSDPLAQVIPWQSFSLKRVYPLAEQAGATFYFLHKTFMHR